MKTQKTKSKWVLFFMTLVGMFLSVSFAIANFDFPSSAPPPPPPDFTFFSPPSTPTYFPPPPALPGVLGPYRHEISPFQTPPAPLEYPKEKEFVDLALTSIQKAVLKKQNGMDGFSISFVIDNKTSKKIDVDVRLICSDFIAEKNFSIRQGVSRKAFFHPFQEAASNREDGMRQFQEGNKTEKCSLGIAHIQYEGFFEYTGPADSDITNNVRSFALSREDSRMIVSEQKQQQDNTVEKVKKLKSPLSEDERETYKKISQEKCLNILISGGDRGSYYNGEPIDPKEETFGPWIKITSAHIAGDRLGYMKQNSVIIDGEDVGVINETGPNGGGGGDIRLMLNKKHYVFPRLVSYDAAKYMPTYHLIYDGKDFGPTHTVFFKLNGDYLIHQKIVKGEERVKYELYANGKKLVDGASGDYDGKNLGYLSDVDSEGKDELIINGKKMGYGAEITFENGHIAYIRGKTPFVVEPEVIFDGKNLGRGRGPVIEKNHIAFQRAPYEINPASSDTRPRVVYDGKELDILGYREIDLAGDHIAYMRELSEEEKPFEYPEDLARVTIDGDDIPVDFLRGTYVEIEEKVDRRECR